MTARQSDLSSTLALLALLALAGAVPPAPKKRRHVSPAPAKLRGGTVASDVDPDRFPLFVAALCKICRTNVIERRGVCNSCRHSDRYRANPRYITPVHHLYETLSDADEIRRPASPTLARPGSDERLSVYADRIARGCTIDHPKDLVWRVDGCGDGSEMKESPTTPARETNATKMMVMMSAVPDAKVELPSGVTGRYRKCRPCPWRRWLPDNAGRKEIVDAVVEHAGPMDEYDDDWW